MNVLHWKLKQVLDKEKVTPYRLIVTSGVAGSTIYRLVNNQTNAVDGNVLDKILNSLHVLTGKDFTINDVVEWQPNPDQLEEIREKINV